MIDQSLFMNASYNAFGSGACEVLANNYGVFVGSLNNFGLMLFISQLLTLALFFLILLSVRPGVWNEIKQKIHAGKEEQNGNH